LIEVNMSTRDEDLQRYFDGEMPAEERTAFEGSLTDDDRARLDALAEMRALLVASLDGAAADVDIWAGLEAKLPKPAGEVVPLPAKRKIRRRVAWTAAGGALLAAAAALAILVGRAPLKPSECDVESLETDGAVATVMKVGDGPASHTVIWTTED
jgi:anti-sigma factor RsiW